MRPNSPLSPLVDSLPGLAPGTRRLALPPLVLALALLWIVPWLGIALAAIGIGVIAFHRDPERTPPAEEDAFLAPADGRVSVLRREDDRLRVGVYMNVADVHVNRAPADGVVANVEHRPGANRPAFSKESERNERVEIDCGGYDLTLIAGSFARRIHPYVSSGDAIERGQRVGHISFGSRADVRLPPSIDREDLRVERGDRVRAGETILAAATSGQDREST